MKNYLSLLLLFLALPLMAQKSSFSIDKLKAAPIEGSFRLDGYWVWGASVVEVDGVFHMYATRVPMSLKFHSRWMVASEIVHATATKPEGPYQFSEIALERRGTHSPHGPWRRSDKPALDVEPNTFYSYIASNPAPVILPDGQGEAEDPFLWHEGDYFYTVFNDQVGDYTGERGAGVIAYSKDCIHWNVCQPAKAYSKEVVWSDGSKTKQGNLERPFILFQDGKPACIFFASMDGTGFNGQEAKNIVIPISDK